MLALVATVAIIVLVHETGHALVARAFGLPVRPTVTWYGPGVLIGSDEIRLTRTQIGLTAAAGPAANLLLAAVAYASGVGLLVGMGVLFAILNLIPFPNSDGHRILHGYPSG